MKQANAVPDRAATLVVHPTPGIGDATTVQDAVDMLPASGGCIFVREGTYVPIDTVTLPDKPVDIIGSGDSTVFSLGNSANIMIFTIPDGLTARRQYNFANFKVTSNSRIGTGIVSIQDSNAFGVVTIRNVNTTHVKQPIEITDGDVAFLTPVFVSVYDCWFTPSDTYFNTPGSPVCSNCAVLVETGGISNLVAVSLYNTRFIVDSFSSVGGTINGDSFGNLDIAFYDCEISLTGEDAVGTIHAERSRFFNFTGVSQLFFIQGQFVSDDYLTVSAFINCNVLGLFIVDTSGLTVTGGWWTNNRIETGTVNGRSTITGVTFRGDGSSAANFPVGGAETAFIAGTSTDLGVASCTFSTTGMTITNYINVSSDIVLTSCAFRGLTGASTAGVRLTGVNNFVIGCDFDTDNWGCPPIKETGLADRNVYNDNLGLNGNSTGTGVDSVFVGTRNTFNGVSQFRGSAATAAAFVTITTQVSASGVVGSGTAKNIGANSMDVRETAIDQFGNTGTVTVAVAAGNDYLLAPNVNIGTARPPYKSYTVEIQSTAAGSPTTYDLRLAMNGEVSW